ncbi:MAG: glycerol-3-phosphate ABC transporter ATP-binding protein [Candidatus Marinimicrobia bacterium CG08_land_8_20_14_0_20_45_22]|nr:MAG: glycerol-3-phosphate ABC transporter ATP-binding protein [Candidatus Marinimicrobia bacterium CG08_land_8_20_14_0_20_45_22]
MANIELKNLTKVFGKETTVIKNLNLTINDGEFYVLVGPSGCGKSTTLRIIAGLEEATEGEVYIDGKLVNNVAPKDRDIAMVFQNYALYPHMTVYENMAFGLKLRNISKSEIDKRVKETAEILELTNLLKRKPKQLSGGQSQRVALGRAIVRNPKVFLFDEPLSNLDAKLRLQMRTEIKKLHQQLKITMVYVTHDQVEAMTMGDRISVMKDGLVYQVDSPLELYRKPADIFVAGFIGNPSMNFVHGVIKMENGLLLDEGQCQIQIPTDHPQQLEEFIGREIVMGIRPEDIHLAQTASAGAPIKLKLELTEPLGNEVIAYFTTGKTVIVSRAGQIIQPDSDGCCQIWIDMDKIHYFDPTTQKRL